VVALHNASSRSGGDALNSLNSLSGASIKWLPALRNTARCLVETDPALGGMLASEPGAGLLVDDDPPGRAGGILAARQKARAKPLMHGLRRNAELTSRLFSGEYGTVGIVFGLA